MPGAAGYDPQDPTWMQEPGDDERPRLDEIESPGPPRRPYRVMNDPWQTQRREDERP